MNDLDPLWRACALVTSILSGSIVAAQDTVWIRQIGTASSEEPFGADALPAGGGAVCGYTQGSLAGPYAGGGTDAWYGFVDPSGQLGWIHQLGTERDESASAILARPDGSVIVAGSTNGSLFGPITGQGDVWLAGSDTSGTIVWSEQFGTNRRDSVSALAQDGAGGFFVAGWTQGDLAASSLGGYDAWVARYDSGGSRLWIQQFGTSKQDFAQAIVPDGAGGVFVGGTRGDNGFGSGDAWLARCTGTGQVLWLERFGAPGSQDYLTGAAADGSGGVIATGETWGRLGGANAGRSDVWIARYDGAGQESWATQFGSAREDRPCDVSPDGLGGFYLCGRTRGALGTPPAGIVDPWVARIDGAGGIVWLRQFGSGSGDSAIGIAADSRGDVFVAGQTSGALGGSHAGSSDIWFARIDGNLITTRECHPAVANSTGLAGRIDGSGSNFVAASELRLSASGLPPHVMTVFLTSRTRDLVSGPGGSDGVLCLGGAVGRYVGAGQVQSSGSTGSAQLEIDLTQTPTPTGLVDVLAGDTWFFQAWYRDVGASSNFTDSLSIAFR